VRLPTFDAKHKATLCPGGLRSRRGIGDEACHCLTELRIDLICYGHYSDQQQTEIDTSQVVLQGLKDADLQHPRFLYQHGGAITLPAPVQPVQSCGGGYQLRGTDWLGGEETKH
jgi:hypothetical protein